jgi:hypothetical protein
MRDCDNMYDHRDRNPANNQKYNLRIATVSQNAANRCKQTRYFGVSSRFKGVCWNKETKKWTARCKGIHLGCFKDEKEAAKAYNNKAIELYGEFAYLNKLG